MTNWIRLGGTLALVLAAAPLCAQNRAAQIADAIGAAPPSLARAAAVIGHDGKLLRKGSNGWTCMPDLPNTPGRDPMCFDQAGMAWAQAWMSHKAPPPGVGLAYMLKGGSDPSNLDPYAKGARGRWVTTGPHVMVLSADVAKASGYPTGANPDTSRPYVMFPDTPYAHIMMPVR